MNIGYCVLCLMIKFSLVNLSKSQEPPEEQNTIANDDVQEKSTSGYLQDIEMVKIYMSSSNSVKIFWGIKPEDMRLNTTYGLFYDIDNKENLTEPKTETQDPCIEVLNLEHCKRYFFAVSPLTTGSGINPNSSNIRSIFTYMDPLDPPLDLHVDFIPGTAPCLLIKWTASCRNIPDPLRYKIQITENFPESPPTTTTSITPLSSAFQQVYTIPVHYGSILEISIANDLPGASFGESYKLKVPEFLQPFDVRLAVNQSSKAFLLYWREPFVPVCDGRYFYEVFVYGDKDVRSDSNYTLHRVNRPGFVYKGNGSEYSFGVDLVCCDYSKRSVMSDLVYGNVNGVIEHVIQF